MLLIICTLPKGLAQRMQQNGVDSCLTTGWFDCGVSKRRGTSSMASSGQVVAHRPHCTQFFSTKRNWGKVVLSIKAEAGQAPTQAMHRLHFAWSTATLPNGARGGSAICSGAASAWLAR